MPRPKGSKNKKRSGKSLVVENFDERIAVVQAEIETMAGELKAKKAELKKVLKEKAKADRLAAAKKAEEEKARLLDAVAASGKTVDEILALLK